VTSRREEEQEYQEGGYEEAQEGQEGYEEGGYQEEEEYQ